MNKTNQQKNTDYDEKQKIRPKEPAWDFTGLEAVVRLWAKGHE